MSDESKRVPEVDPARAPTKISTDRPADERPTDVPLETTGRDGRQLAGLRICVRCGTRFDAGEQFCSVDGDILIEDPLVLVGLTIGSSIRIDGVIGTGGMGVVYRATQLELDRTVAIKVVRGNFLGDHEIAARFRREAHSVARLRHPSIVTVHDFGTADNIGAYIVMEYLEGRSLRAEIAARNRLSVGETIVLLQQICGALHTAHRAGVVHRDLKPENVFLEDTGDGVRAKVLDFGIAKLLDLPKLGDTRITATGIFLGTPLYASPEQGQGRPLDGRSDIYSLGAIAYEALTGRPPFLAADVDSAIRQHALLQPTALRDLVEDVPRSLEAAILRALSKDPDDRFQTAIEFGQSLDFHGDRNALVSTGSFGRRIPSERRTLTILKTHLQLISAADEVDPEDWGHIVDGAQDWFARVVTRNEGTLAPAGCDAMCAYFGAAVTREDDAHRAADAAVEMLDEARRYALEVAAMFGVQLAVRFGINTGPVVVRGHAGSAAEVGASGDAITVASLLASLAEPMTVVLGDATMRRVSGAFECRDLGSVELPSRSRPIMRHQLIGPRLMATADREKPVVGRASELATLAEVTEALGAGIGRIAIIIGEPGLGKTRLVDEWRHSSTDEGERDLQWVTGRCQSTASGHPYHLVVELLHALLGLSPMANEAERRNALESAVLEVSDKARHDVDDHLGHLLSISQDDQTRGRIRSLDPLRLKANQASAVRELLDSLSRRRPVVVVIEDLHWADASSVDLLVDVLPLAAQSPIVFCLVSRLDTEATGWRIIAAARSAAGARLTEISLAPLSPEDSRTLIANLVGAGSLPETAIARVLERAEGNPLFAEEVVRSLVECGAVVRQGDVWEVCEGRTDIEIPSTIQSLLLARVDRLSTEARRVLQVSSVIGRQVRVPVLVEVLSRDGQAGSSPTFVSSSTTTTTGPLGIPTTSLNAIEASGLFRLAATRPELEYAFRHALVREAVYSSLLKSDRKRLHAAVGEALERHVGESDGHASAELAYHFTRSESHEKAFCHLRLAADYASGRYAIAEALAFYEAALLELEKMPDASMNGDVIHREAATELGEAIGDLHLRTGHYVRSRKAFEQAADGATSAVDSARLWRKIGNSYVAAHGFASGLDAFSAAEAKLESADCARDPEWWREWVQIQLDRVWLHYWTYDVDGIAALVEKSREVVLEYGSPVQRSGYLQALVLMAARRDRYVVDDETVRIAEASLVAADECGMPSVMVGAGFLVGFIQLLRTEYAAAGSRLRSVLDQAVRTGDRPIEARCLAYLLVVDRMTGRTDNVRAAVDRAREVAESARLPEYLGVVEGMTAWLALHDGNGAEAVRHAAAAVEHWDARPVVFPFWWIGLLPGIAANLEEGDPSGALEAARALLAPQQMRLPTEVVEPIKKALDLEVGASAESAAALLREAIEAARRLGFV